MRGRIGISRSSRLIARKRVQSYKCNYVSSLLQRPGRPKHKLAHSFTRPGHSTVTVQNATAYSETYNWGSFLSSFRQLLFIKFLPPCQLILVLLFAFKCLSHQILIALFPSHFSTCAPSLNQFFQFFLCKFGI